MVRHIKSLRFNLDDGVDVQFHREHRSKRGRSRHSFATSPAYFKYKRRKNEEKYSNDDEIFAI